MSILPSRNLGTTSSSSSNLSSPNPKSNYGSFFPSSPPQQQQQQQQQQQLPSNQPLLSQSSIPPHTLESLRISTPRSSSPLSDVVSGPTAQSAEDSGGPSQKVNPSGRPNGKKSWTPEKMGSKLGTVSRAGRGDTQYREKSYATGGPQHIQQTFGSPNIQRNPTHSSGKKHQMVNGNHLLNFHHHPISRPQPRAPPPRRQQKRKPYNKDLFLQANYKFVVLDSGNYVPESMDPDKMLQWENIVCVKYSSPFPVQCPICLEDPLCPQMTSCGHIFCFPCILQYFLMGEEDNKGEIWKKCPLCFMMISSKDLYTIYIEEVKQYSVGDSVELMLLSRQKDSFALSQKNKQASDTIEEDQSPFSKFTLTSDVDLSVRKAISELDSWLAKAESGLVDDLERLPYVCAAMEQLERRKKYWNEQQFFNLNKACKDANSHRNSHGSLLTANSETIDLQVPEGGWGSSPTDTNKVKLLVLSNLSTIEGESSLDQAAYVIGSYEDQEGSSSSSCDDNKCAQGHSNDFEDGKDKDSYNFYQAVDGQHLILHPLNMKCLLHHYGSYDRLPHSIRGKIIQLETVTQSEAMRRRYRFLSHISLTTTFQFCEIDLSEVLPHDALLPFMDEIKNREKQRKRLSRKEQVEKLKAEAASAHYIPMPHYFAITSHDDSPNFSVDDFEALGSSTVTSSSPSAVGERQLFSSVARLGFAAGHDSPSLKNETAHSVLRSNASTDSSSVTVEGLEVVKNNETAKKGKKSSRVLLSTAGVRRY